MTSKSENAVPAKGGEFGIREKAWQLLEYQTGKTTATDNDADSFEPGGNITARVLLSVVCERYGVSRPRGRVILELAGIGERA